MPAPSLLNSSHDFMTTENKTTNAAREAGHTPTPWQNGEHSVYVWSKDGNVCACGHPTASPQVRYTEAGCGDGLHAAVDNARHIVRCVNSHDDLLAALQKCVAELEHVLGPDKWFPCMDEARAAIAKAKGR